MSTTRSTDYLDCGLHKTLKIKSIETESSVSELINMAIRHSLQEDEEDLKTFNQRKKENTVSFESSLKYLNGRGII